MFFYSHPGKLLSRHCEEVSHMAVGYCPRPYKQAAELAGLAHDFGKFTTYFQEYLLEKKAHGKLKQHGFISALFGAYCAFDRWGEDSFIPLIIYSVIYHHHGSVSNYKEILPVSVRDYGETLKENIEIAYRQAEDVNNNLDEVINAYNGLIDNNLIKTFILKFNPEPILRKLLKIEYSFSVKGIFKNETSYFAHQFIFSALIAADKISASGAVPESIKWVSCSGILKAREQIIASNDSNAKNDQINSIREHIFANVQSNTEKYADNNRIFTITSPTGSGKTWTGFCAAVKLRYALEDNRKIVYVLPYTSIIDQNYSSIEQLLKISGEMEGNERLYLLKHHHLANVDSSAGEDQYDPASSSVYDQLLTEDWHSGIIVTTFVQFFESMITPRNRMLKKFHNYQGAIFLIDEIQAMDVKYYPLVSYVLNILCSEYDSRIILMTATRPVVFAGNKENRLPVMELLDNYAAYYSCFNRTCLIPKLDKIKIDDFIYNVCSIIDEKCSCMIVCNTIQCSLDIFDKVKNIFGDHRSVYYLSTNLVPAQRAARIQQIAHELANQQNVILVSTQVVEAGVDLDFDIVIRDFAPFDSIIQCAGRCNRNGIEFNENRGKVYIYNLVDEKRHSFSTSIYGFTNLQLTRETLENRGVIEEKDYLELINSYYSKVKENISSKQAQDLITAMEHFDMSREGVGGFSLIKNNPDYIDVLFRLNDQVEEAYQLFWKVIKIKDFQQKQDQYLKIKNKLKKYTISLPNKYLPLFTCEPLGNYGLFVSLPPEGVDDYYNSDIGFKRGQDENYIAF